MVNLVKRVVEEISSILFGSSRLDNVARDNNLIKPNRVEVIQHPFIRKRSEKRRHQIHIAINHY